MRACLRGFLLARVPDRREEIDEVGLMPNVGGARRRLGWARRRDLGLVGERPAAAGAERGA